MVNGMDHDDGRRVTRRRAIGVGTAAVAAGAATAGPAPAAARRSRADVVVVGAGFAGLAAATALRTAGRSVIVLEAQRRVGGRVLDQPIGRGEIAEMGGQWSGPGQDRALRLARDLGVRTFETYASGDNVLVLDGVSRRYAGDIPPLGGAALAGYAAAATKLSALARELPATAPWTSEVGRRLDARTIGGWIADDCPDPTARRFLALAIRGVYGTEPADVSLLDLASLVKATGGDLSTVLFAAQSIRFAGGPQRMAQRLAERLGGRVRLGETVRRISWDRAGAEVTCDGSVHRGRRVIVALPTTIAGRLTYEPPLPAARDQLTQRQPMGSVVKANAVYDRPFWRARGLSGTAILVGSGPVSLVYDNSPAGGRPGVLVAFLEAGESRPYLADARRRRAAILDGLASAIGDAARRPRAMYVKAWADDPYVRGAYGSYNPPGTLTQFGDTARRPVGPLHWAGADLALEWTGYIDGALESGRGAARAIARSLA
jgi:monoamine oxidase